MRASHSAITALLAASSTLTCAALPRLRHQSRVNNDAAEDAIGSLPQSQSLRRETETDPQLSKFECGHVFQRYDPGSVSQILGSMSEVPELNPVFGPLFQTLSGDGLIKYGVEVRKICASCTDHSPKSATKAFHEFCGKSAYGSKATFSGLLMTPLEHDGDGELVVRRGTMPGYVYARSTVSLNLGIPSERGDFGFVPGVPHELINMFAVAAGHVSIMPDMMGYGESAYEVFKAFTVKKAYQTASIPLWLEAQAIVSDETHCASALADATVVAGYSEGGYAALTIAEALHHGLGVEIITLHSGGAPYDVKLTSKKIVEGIRDGPNEAMFLLRLVTATLLGSAYSTTYKDMANYNKKQNIIADESRCDAIDLVWAGFDRPDVFGVIDADDPLSFFDQISLDFVLGEDLPSCSKKDVPERNKLCEAYDENNLVDTLLQVSYLTTVCHSSQDELVDVGNVPDLSSNSLISWIDPPTDLGVPGDHTTGALACGVVSLSGIPQYQQYPITNKHTDGGCRRNKDTMSKKSKDTISKKSTSKKSKNRSQKSKGKKGKKGFKAPKCKV